MGESPAEGAIRFAEEYGYNRWAEARDELAALRQELARKDEALRAIRDAIPQSYDWYQRRARDGLSPKEAGEVGPDEARGILKGYVSRAP